MKTFLLASLVALFGFSSVSNADLAASFSVDQQGDTTGFNIFSGAGVLPAFGSVDEIRVELATTRVSDIGLLNITAPDGTVFELLNNNGGSQDLGLVGGSGILSNVADYTFVAAGGTGTFTEVGGVVPNTDPFDANSWGSSGPQSSGSWSLGGFDFFSSNRVAVGSVTIVGASAIPEPASAMVLCGVGLAGVFRRRR